MNPGIIIGLVIVVVYFFDHLFGWRSEEDIPARRIFISHSWNKGGNEYMKFVKKLEKENIAFYNHSIPSNKALSANSKRQLEIKFRKKMIYCSKIFVLANSGISNNSFVKMEIEIAKSLGKQIIAVKPNGQYSIPSFISRNASKVISNNITSIINTIKE